MTPPFFLQYACFIFPIQQKEDIISLNFINRIHINKKETDLSDSFVKQLG